MQPQNPKIYHIVHIDKLQSIINSGGLLSDNEVIRLGLGGTTIGMNSIKQRRLTELRLSTYPDLFVGQCVPFYFCPRSVMLYMMHMGNSTDITYQGGQDGIIHLEADLMGSIAWANTNAKRWVFTSSNAGSRYFEDFNDLAYLNKIDWSVVSSSQWSYARDKKQAEFLCENNFSWNLVERIGVSNQTTYQQVLNIINNLNYKPLVEVKSDWYY
ncbi:type II toxin-antitoxin system toxin DNA ADP-ribosyl transferase DarT [Aliarcobacter butzleri]|uniref:type II toxin-antitoxin system toxin DNA ADP-ribosyl transferase DarT n=1 Tax=Aliarcobacter butzleri TaxID=28197 RepID=UPI0021B617BF|nr:DUF4433 domain-containing protein [Aliarcobacter butzleri]MCT7636402.1 DUF4433 domain-containing protein [Aliarcobacter butzleri]